MNEIIYVVIFVMIILNDILMIGKKILILIELFFDY